MAQGSSHCRIHWSNNDDEHTQQYPNLLGHGHFGQLKQHVLELLWTSLNNCYGTDQQEIEQPQRLRPSLQPIYLPWPFIHTSKFWKRELWFFTVRRRFNTYPLLFFITLFILLFAEMPDDTSTYMGSMKSPGLISRWFPPSSTSTSGSTIIEDFCPSWNRRKHLSWYMSRNFNWSGNVGERIRCLHASNVITSWLFLFQQLFLFESNSSPGKFINFFLWLKLVSCFRRTNVIRSVFV